MKKRPTFERYKKLKSLQKRTNNNNDHRKEGTTLNVEEEQNTNYDVSLKVIECNRIRLFFVFGISLHPSI